MHFASVAKGENLVLMLQNRPLQQHFSTKLRKVTYAPVEMLEAPSSGINNRLTNVFLEFPFEAHPYDLTTTPLNSCKQAKPLEWKMLIIISYWNFSRDYLWLETHFPKELRKALGSSLLELT